ncbi:hypothetical protein [Streptomyces sp. WMMC897]|uniref:hypothetical protein n=1 Tax=Streptomyces sp. WMMC897 TaxID=3014782 RepID=UPI0022B72605|nr:hypothetical protein [Streptomyces sp. WMMC897]MCZ7413113.1 hypothetical protein [Streptomyces sp. WMMC897]MCZ7415503.1 hypothetical protein [Streptomyces sp. WMMC897]
MTDTVLYLLIAVFFTGLITWLALAVVAVLGLVRGLAWTARRITTRTKGGCPGRGGTFDTCQCGTQRPQRGTTWAEVTR